MFSTVDASAILATRVPSHVTCDRIAWSITKDGQYDVKTGYRFWYENNIVTAVSSQSSGWSRIWRLILPHKMKIFLRRFCQNNLPVRNRLKSKGVGCPLICPMCGVDVEHLMHVFLDCTFARSCWHYVGLQYNWDEIFSANDWLLNKLEVASVEETAKICTTLYGIWMARNRKVWDNVDLTGIAAMQLAFRNVQEWKEARQSKRKGVGGQVSGTKLSDTKWVPPPHGSYKVNVDASWIPGAEISTIGMVLRDNAGVFLEGRTVAMGKAANAFEAECIGVREALSWVKNRTDRDVVVESDSKMTIEAITGDHEYVLEVGHVIDQCKMLLHSLTGTSVKHIRRQANKVAHGLAKMPCSVNCCNIFM